MCSHPSVEELSPHFSKKNLVCNVATGWGQSFYLPLAASFGGVAPLNLIKEFAYCTYSTWWHHHYSCSASGQYIAQMMVVIKHHNVIHWNYRISSVFLKQQSDKIFLCAVIWSQPLCLQKQEGRFQVRYFHFIAALGVLLIVKTLN